MSLPQNLKKILLTEGGAVFDGTIRIEHKYLESTYKSFCDNILSKCTNYKKYSTLGSYGQKASYGDIDIGVQCDDINDFVKVLTDVCTKAGYKVDFMKGLGVISVQYDIVSPNNRERIGKCQIDCMPIKDLSYASWSYSSPIKNSSEYSGLYRNECIFACARYAHYKILEKDENGEPTEWSRYFYNLGKGLMIGVQTNISDKTGKKVKTIRSISKELITSNPQEIINICFGKSFKSDDMMSYENCFNAIMSNNFILIKERDKILKSLYKGLKDKKVEIPKDLTIALKGK
jgi:hypothetical protein